MRFSGYFTFVFASLSLRYPPIALCPTLVVRGPTF